MHSPVSFRNEKVSLTHSLPVIGLEINGESVPRECSKLPTASKSNSSVSSELTSLTVRPKELVPVNEVYAKVACVACKHAHFQLSLSLQWCSWRSCVPDRLMCNGRGTTGLHQNSCAEHTNLCCSFPYPSLTSLG